MRKRRFIVWTCFAVLMLGAAGASADELTDRLEALPDVTVLTEFTPIQGCV